MALSLELFARLRWWQTGSGDLSTPTDAGKTLDSFLFTDGEGANQAERIWTDRRSLNASADETLDLTGGISDALGTITFTSIKGIRVFAHAENTNNVVIGAASSNPFLGPLGGTTPTYTIRPGAIWIATNPTAAGWSVSSADQLKIANSGAGTSVGFDIAIWGTV